VPAFEDSALIMRVKFRSKPGLQFLVQRQVFRRLQELFDDRGLEFATRHVQVRLPQDATSERHDVTGETPPVSATSSGKVGLSAAASAAIAMAIADEEAKKQQLEADKDLI
jgi:hypothetical protein